MKYILFIALAIVAQSAFTADIDLSIRIDQPGFYGTIDIGDYPPPRLIYRQPIIIERERGSHRSPVYLHVPRKHSKNWRKYCRQYHACDKQAYFVRDDWYNREYIPRYQKQHDTNRNDHRNDHRDNPGNNRQHDNNRRYNDSQ